MKKLVLFLALVCSSALAHAAPFSSIVAFGDSEVDNGNRLALQGTKPGPRYWQGRHSNGKVSVEIYAETLGISLLDYGVGGAFTGRGNVDPDPLLADTGLLDQFDTFASSFATADPNALYFIYAGANDFNAFGFDAASQNGVLDNYKTLMTGLVAMGAQHFMVANRAGWDEFSDFLNSELSSFAIATGYDITFFDSVPVIVEMEDPNNPFGFTTTDPCYTGGLINGPAPCSTPDETVYWDVRGHLSAAAQAILGERMAAALPGVAIPNSVPEANTVLLILAAMLALGWMRTKRKVAMRPLRYRNKR